MFMKGMFHITYITKGKIANAISLLLVAYYGYYFLTHIIKFNEFSRSMQNQVFGFQVANVLTFTMVAIEGVIVVSLLTHKGIQIAARAIIAVTTVVSAYIIMVLSKAFNRTPCSCVFGVKGLSWGGNLGICFILLFLGISILYLSKNKYAKQAGDAENPIKSTQ